MLSFSSTVVEALQSGKSAWDTLSILLNKDPARVFTEYQAPEENVWRFLFQLASEADRQHRHAKKEMFKDIHQVIDRIIEADNIVVILGAGGSVGLDFRSPGGLYDSIAKDGIYDDPCDVFDVDSFNQDPSVFWHYAHTIFPPKDAKHSLAHLFLQKLEENGKLLRVYTQNVDTLECGIPDEKICCVHGSWRDCKCANCGMKQTIEDIRPFVEQKQIPRCKLCRGSIIPGIVFFGQPTNLNNEQAMIDAHDADLLLVIGTSLRVAPISELPKMMGNVPSILINRAPVTCSFNGQILGECDDIINMIENELGWNLGTTKCATDAIFFPPNNFVFESDNSLGTRIVDTTRSKFLVTSHACDVCDLE